MSGLEIVLALALAWAVGALVFVLTFEKYPLNELVAILTWPLFVPAALTIRLYLRLRYTCRDCGRRSGDRKHHDIHLRVRNGCPGATLPADADQKVSL